MAKKGLRKWVKDGLELVQILPTRKSDGSYPKCGSSEKKKKLSKMRAHCESKSDVQRATCGCRKKKQAVANTGPKPSRAATFAKRKKLSNRN